MSFLARLEAEPWYSDVADEFASVAPDVPAPLWQGELLSEDSSLDPTAQDYLHSGHFGLFQENAAFSTTVGLPAATTAQLQNPQYNAYVAALRMEQALKQTGASTFTTQVEALEQAGWPGAVSSGETSTRVANVNEIASEEGGNGNTDPYPNDSPVQQWVYNHLPGWWKAGAQIDPTKPGGSNPAAAGQALGGTGASITAGFGQIGQSLFIGGLILAFIAGGFALLAASINQGGSSGHPVPVPV